MLWCSIQHSVFPDKTDRPLIHEACYCLLLLVLSSSTCRLKPFLTGLNLGSTTEPQGPPSFLGHGCSLESFRGLLREKLTVFLQPVDPGERSVLPSIHSQDLASVLLQLCPRAKPRVPCNASEVQGVPCSMPKVLPEEGSQVN